MAAPGSVAHPPAVHGAVSLDSEVATILHGGISEGSVTDSLLQVSFCLDDAAAGLPENSRLRGAVTRTRSGHPSTTLVGDAQGFTNIAAPSRGRLYTLWYHQRLARRSWSIDLGLVPADHFFDVADSAGLLLNSSFGVQPTWSANTTAPIYPTAGIGAIASWTAEAWTNRTGVFQANPDNRSRAFGSGALLIDELDHQARTPAGGTYKLGLWSYHPHNVDPYQGPRPVVLPSTWGAYVSAEQPFTGPGHPGATAFLRMGFSPTQASAVPFDLEAGVLVPGPVTTRPNDQLSLGIALADLRGSGVEVAYEATYSCALTPHVALQPDLQMIDHPTGRPGSVIVTALRLHIGFE